MRLGLQPTDRLITGDVIGEWQKLGCGAQLEELGHWGGRPSRTYLTEALSSWLP